MLFANQNNSHGINKMIEIYKKSILYLIIVCSVIYGLVYFSISDYNREHDHRYQVKNKSSIFTIQNLNKCDLKVDDVESKKSSSFKNELFI